MAEINPKIKKIFPTHIYDYNYKVSEGYYKPQKKFMNTSMMGRQQLSPPKHKSYAERFASDPWYGESHGLPYGQQRSALNEPLIKLSNRPFRTSSLVREIKELEEDDIPLNVRANRRRKRFQDEDEKLGIRSRNNFPIPKNGRPANLSKEIQEKLFNLNFELPKLGNGLNESSFPRGNNPRTESFYRNFSDKPLSSPRIRTKSYNDEFDLPPLRTKRRGQSPDEDFFESSTIYQASNNGVDKVPIPYKNRINKIRDDRRYQQSRNITDGIDNIVEKMRTANVNFENAYTDRRDRGQRAATIDPVVKDQQSKSHVSYCLAKHKF